MFETTNNFKVIIPSKKDIEAYYKIWNSVKKIVAQSGNQMSKSVWCN